MYIVIIIFFLILIFIYKYNNNIEKLDINKFIGGEDEYEFTTEIIELDVNTDKEIIKLHLEDETLLNKTEKYPKLLVLDVRSKTEIGKGRLCYSIYAYSFLNNLIEPDINDKKKQKTHFKQIWKGIQTGLFPIKNTNNKNSNLKSDKKNKNNLYKNPNLRLTYIMLFLSMLSKGNLLIFSENGDKALQVAKKLQLTLNKEKKRNIKYKPKIYVIVNGGYNELTHILKPELICHPECVPIRKFGERESTFSLKSFFPKKKKEKEKSFINIFGGKNKHLIEQLDIQKEPDKIKELIKNMYKNNKQFIKPLDVRSKKEINEGFLCDACLVYSFLNLLNNVKDTKSLLKNNNRLFFNLFQAVHFFKEVLIYCSDGKRSMQVAEKLSYIKDKQIKKIYVIVNGGYRELKHILPDEYICAPRCEKKNLLDTFKKSLNF